MNEKFNAAMTAYAASPTEANRAAIVEAVATPAQPIAPPTVRKAYICTACDGVYADEKVTQCDCMPAKQEFTEGTITYPSAQPIAPAADVSAPTDELVNAIAILREALGQLEGGSLSVAENAKQRGDTYDSGYANAMAICARQALTATEDVADGNPYAARTWDHEEHPSQYADSVFGASQPAGEFLSASVQKFLTDCAGTSGGMVNGNNLARYAKRLLDAAATGEILPAQCVPDVLFDINAIFEEITRELGKSHCIQHAAISATLDAAVRLIRAPSTITVPDCGACPGDGSICPIKCRLAEESPPARAAAPVSGPTEKLLTIIAYAYQIAGAHDAPEHILDVLSDPEAATGEQIEAMLPYMSAPVSDRQHIPGNFTTHRAAWRDAITECINHELNARELDRAAYWEHELAAFDRAFARLLDKPEQSISAAPVSGQGASKLPLEDAINEILKPHVAGWRRPSLNYQIAQLLDSRPCSEDSRAKVLNEAEFESNAARAIFKVLKLANMSDADWDNGTILGANNEFRTQIIEAAIRALASSATPADATKAKG